MPDVFISYSRKDKELARQLTEALEAQGRDVWIDFEDIPFAEDWWQEVVAGIEGSENAIFILSPDSLASEVCGLEVNHIVHNNKRLIPILYRNVRGLDVPKTLSSLNWIYFETPETFDQSFSQLVNTITTDIDALRQHTRLLVLAREWEVKSHNPSLLLRGVELDEFAPMLERTDLTDLQREFLRQSQVHHIRAQNIWRFTAGFIGGLLGMGFWAFSVFRSPELITPLRLIYTLSLGEVFGVFNGLLAMLAIDLPTILPVKLSKNVQVVVRIVASLIISVLAWAVFGWFYLQNPTLSQQDTNAILFGGVGLAAGFIIRILFKLPGWLAAAVTAVFTYIPIYVTFQQWQAGSDLFSPLIYLDRFDQVYSVCIPIVIFIAVGANAQALYQEARVSIRRLTARGATTKTEGLPA
jgi:hypothetical protein